MEKYPNGFPVDKPAMRHRELNGNRKGNIKKNILVDCELRIHNPTKKK